MGSTNKPRVIKDFDKISDEMRDQVKAAYPDGFNAYLISFTNKEGQLCCGLPFETEDRMYLLRINNEDTGNIDDDDFFDDGNKDDDLDDSADFSNIPDDSNDDDSAATMNDSF
ncbi:MAG: hypothetical protein IKW77_08920 [Salinivirgaceae bacterium]|jgi:hypothetical protein|nr:hypothetical protein [Salinivirgaceae bacterium]